MPIKIASEAVEDVASLLESYAYLKSQCEVDFKDIGSITVYGGLTVDDSSEPDDSEFDEDGEYIGAEPSVSFTVNNLDETDRKVLREAMYKIAARKLLQVRMALQKLGIEIETTPNHPV